MMLVGAFIFVERKRGGASVSYHEMTRLINDDQAIVVDVRDAKEYSAGHIVDAVNIPFSKLVERSVELDKYRAKTIVIVDKVGQQAGAAAKQLMEAGYTVARMQGGMSEWQGQNLPVVKG